MGIDTRGEQEIAAYGGLGDPIIKVSDLPGGSQAGASGDIQTGIPQGDMLDQFRVDVPGGFQAGSSGGSLKKPLAFLHLADAFQRAAYFADTVYENAGGNILVSPMSLNLALGLAAEGASGKTAEEMYGYLGGSDYGNFAKQYMDYADSLTREADAEQGGYQGKYSFQYSIANSVWVNSNRTLTEEYKNAAQDRFRAEVDSLDFLGNPSQAVNRINSWCEDKTKGMIPRILTDDSVSGDPAAILVNTVYFESPWREVWKLEQHKFQALSGKTTGQEMLKDTLSDYYENKYATAFGKAYFNGFEFIGILPKAEGDFRISDLDLQSLLESKETKYDVKALMPKLDYESATSPGEIVGLLRAQGLQLPFDSVNAEFDRMLEMGQGENLYIDDILQKCKIELDEDGTRAAAVTALIMQLNMAVTEPKEVKEVYLDRPFAFLIYDSIKEEIVFVGKVTEIK